MLIKSPVNSSTQQLSLGLSLRDGAMFTNFYAGENQVLLDYCQAFLKNPVEHLLYFWSVQSSGKTHLLQACCHAASQRGLRVSFIPITCQSQLTPDILNDLDQVDLVCIDDIDKINGQPDWELALFNAYNYLKESGGSLIITGNAPIQQLNFNLPDLTSRLTSGAAFQLHALTDEQKQQALQMRAQQRGMPLPDNVAQYMLVHYNRDMATLFAALDILDQKSLQAKRKLTIPFVKTSLALVEQATH